MLVAGRNRAHSLSADVFWPVRTVCHVCRLSSLQYDKAAAAQLQATVEAERTHMQRSKDHADQLSSTLASMPSLTISAQAPHSLDSRFTGIEY